MSKIDKQRKKIEKEINRIATAFLKARSKYPPDPEIFRCLAGYKEFACFCETMNMLQSQAIKHCFILFWYYVEDEKVWRHELVDVAQKK